MSYTYLVLINLCIIGIVIRTIYEILKKNDRVDTKNKIIFSVVFFGMGLVLISPPLFCSIDPIALDYSNGIRITGFMFVGLGILLAFGGLLQLRGLENIDHLITTGFYKKVRHPMYTGFIFWLLGWVVYYGAVISFIVIVICIIFILYWRFLEEKNMKIQYGEMYIEYIKTTWF
jgi:protein-S-isoprenylcysteine O-methyltransferase Ste14